MNPLFLSDSESIAFGYFTIVCAQLLSYILTVCNPMDCSPPRSSIHGIFLARIMEWVAMPSSRDLPHLGIKSASLALQADSLSPATKEAQYGSHLWLLNA